LINISKENTISFILTIGVHIDNIGVLEFIKNRLNCGSIYISKKVVHLNVKKINDIKNILIPVFDKLPLNGTKYLEYLKFKEAVARRTSRYVFYKKKCFFY
jgi:hypothetical protein